MPLPFNHLKSRCGFPTRPQPPPERPLVHSHQSPEFRVADSHKLGLARNGLGWEPHSQCGSVSITALPYTTLPILRIHRSRTHCRFLFGAIPNNISNSFRPTKSTSAQLMPSSLAPLSHSPPFQVFRLLSGTAFLFSVLLATISARRFILGRFGRMVNVAKCLCEVLFRGDCYLRDSSDGRRGGKQVFLSGRTNG